jgi:hypothetical protein
MQEAACLNQRFPGQAQQRGACQEQSFLDGHGDAAQVDCHDQGDGDGCEFGHAAGRQQNAGHPTRFEQYKIFRCLEHIKFSSRRIRTWRAVCRAAREGPVPAA